MGTQYLQIRGWTFSTEELALLPVFEAPAQPRAVRELIEDAGSLAVAYHAAGCNCKRLAELAGARYRLFRQALAWYGIWPADPVPLRGGNGDGPGRQVRRKKVRRARARHVLKKKIRRVVYKPLQKNDPASDLSRATLLEVVARAYLRNDRCPPDCKGRESCLDPAGACCYQEVPDYYA